MATPPAERASEPERALGFAYRFLNRRERTTDEVRRHLGGKEIGAAAIDGAVRELSELGYLDDARYARLFAEDKRVLQGWGTERIRRSLLSCGVEGEVIDAALGGGSRDLELERALDLLDRRFAAAPRDRGERERMLGVLLRKGYDGDLALDALAGFAGRR